MAFALGALRGEDVLVLARAPGLWFLGLDGAARRQEVALPGEVAAVTMCAGAARVLAATPRHLIVLAHEGQSWEEVCRMERTPKEVVGLEWSGPTRVLLALRQRLQMFDLLEPSNGAMALHLSWMANMAPAWAPEAVPEQPAPLPVAMYDVEALQAKGLPPWWEWRRELVAADVTPASPRLLLGLQQGAPFVDLWSRAPGLDTLAQPPPRGTAAVPIPLPADYMRAHVIWHRVPVVSAAWSPSADPSAPILLTVCAEGVVRIWLGWGTDAGDPSFALWAVLDAGDQTLRRAAWIVARPSTLGPRDASRAPPAPTAQLDGFWFCVLEAQGSLAMHCVQQVALPMNRSKSEIVKVATGNVELPPADQIARFRAVAFFPARQCAKPDEILLACVRAQEGEASRNALLTRLMLRDDLSKQRTKLLLAQHLQLPLVPLGTRDGDGTAPRRLMARHPAGILVATQATPQKIDVVARQPEGLEFFLPTLLPDALAAADGEAAAGNVDTGEGVAHSNSQTSPLAEDPLLSLHFLGPASPPCLVGIGASGHLRGFQLLRPAGSHGLPLAKERNGDVRTPTPLRQVAAKRHPVEVSALANEYEVTLVPDPRYGLGLHLELNEASEEGGATGAVVRGFKRHPETGAALPAQKAGVISVGDALVSINRHVVDGLSLEVALDVVKMVTGMDGVKDRGITMRFRGQQEESLGESRSASTESLTARGRWYTDDVSGRRSTSPTRKEREEAPKGLAGCFWLGGRGAWVEAEGGGDGIERGHFLGATMEGAEGGDGGVLLSLWRVDSDTRLRVQKMEAMRLAEEEGCFESWELRAKETLCATVPGVTGEVSISVRNVLEPDTPGLGDGLYEVRWGDVTVRLRDGGSDEPQLLAEDRGDAPALASASPRVGPRLAGTSFGGELLALCYAVVIMGGTHETALEEVKRLCGAFTVGVEYAHAAVGRTYTYEGLPLAEGGTGPRLRVPLWPLKGSRLADFDRFWKAVEDQRRAGMPTPDKKEGRQNGGHRAEFLFTDHASSSPASRKPAASEAALSAAPESPVLTHLFAEVDARSLGLLHAVLAGLQRLQGESLDPAALLFSLFWHMRRSLSIPGELPDPTAQVCGFLSGAQGPLLQRLQAELDVRVRGESAWDFARKAGVHVWARDEEQLLDFAGAVAGAAAKDCYGKDPLDAAILFTCCGKLTALEAVARTDRTSRFGAALVRLLQKRRSPKSREVMVKNAHMLLSKRRYLGAAALFLVPEEPMVKEAMSVLRKHANDWGLMFYVARVVAARVSGKRGGGKFCYDQIVRDLVHGPKFLEMLPPSNRMSGVLRCLLVGDPKGAEERVRAVAEDTGDMLPAGAFHLRELATSFQALHESRPPRAAEAFDAESVAPILEGTMQRLGVAISPFLLLFLSADAGDVVKVQTRVAGALAAAQLGVPAMKLLGLGPGLAQVRNRLRAAGGYGASAAESPPQATRSSLFAGFDAPAAPAAAATASIFDDFGTPPEPPVNAAKTRSSIFDGFDAPPARKAEPAPAVAEIPSSIFDDFAVPPPRPKAQVPAAAPTASMLDGWDPEPAPSPTGTPSASSVYAIEVPRPQPVTAGEAGTWLRGAQCSVLARALAVDLLLGEAAPLFAYTEDLDIFDPAQNAVRLRPLSTNPHPGPAFPDVLTAAAASLEIVGGFLPSPASASNLLRRAIQKGLRPDTGAHLALLALCGAAPSMRGALLGTRAVTPDLLHSAVLRVLEAPGAAPAPAVVPGKLFWQLHLALPVAPPSLGPSLVVAQRVLLGVFATQNAAYDIFAKAMEFPIQTASFHSPKSATYVKNIRGPHATGAESLTHALLLRIAFAPPKYQGDNGGAFIVRAQRHPVFAAAARILCVHYLRRQCQGLLDDLPRVGDVPGTYELPPHPSHAPVIALDSLGVRSVAGRASALRIAGGLQAEVLACLQAWEVRLQRRFASIVLSVDVASSTSDNRDADTASDVDANIETSDEDVVRSMVRVKSGLAFHSVRMRPEYLARVAHARSPQAVAFTSGDARAWFLRSGAEHTPEGAARRLLRMCTKFLARPLVPMKHDLAEGGGNGAVEVAVLPVDSASPQSNAKRFGAPGKVVLPGGFHATYAHLSGDATLDPGMLLRPRQLFRLVEPWEVEPISEGAGSIIRHGILGRNRYAPTPRHTLPVIFDLLVASVFGTSGNEAHLPLHKMEAVNALKRMWVDLEGGEWLLQCLGSAVFPEVQTAKALRLASPLPPPPPYSGCIATHLHRNALLRRVHLPHRFTALVQVELLDLKNLSPGTTGAGGASGAGGRYSDSSRSPSPGASRAAGAKGGGRAVSKSPTRQGSLWGRLVQQAQTKTLELYTVQRLKRLGSSVQLSNSSRTIDSLVTSVTALDLFGGGTVDRDGPGVGRPTPWACTTGFRFALPEDFPDVPWREAVRIVARAIPQVVHVCVYEKKAFFKDSLLGDLEIPLAELSDERPLEEWLPLRCERGSAWFVHVRVSLRFIVMVCDEGDPGRDASFEVPAGAAELEERESDDSVEAEDRASVYLGEF